jgi:Family of unknown function (DUF6174)
MRAFFVGVILVGALVACSSSTDVSAAAKASLDQHQALWGQRTFGSYAFDLDLQDVAFTASVRITVNGTTVTTVIDKTTGEPPTGDYQYPSVDDLFATAQAAFGQKNTTLQMEFNEQYGYPTALVVSSLTGTGAYSAHVSNFSVSP